jgi:hypothetical protein
MLYNIKGTTNDEWYSKAYLSHSSWTDLFNENQNYWSLLGNEGHGYRDFFINRNYGGCSNDAGWVVISNNRTACSWETVNTIKYSDESVYQNWTTGNIKTADSFVVMVREDTSKTVLHITGDKENDVFTDISPSNHIISNQGNVTSSTVIKKVGDTSLYFDASANTYLSIEDSGDWTFGKGDWTIDFWVTFSDLSRVHDGLFGRNDFQWIAMEYNHDGDKTLNLWIDSNNSSGWEVNNLKTRKNDWIADKWYHIAIVRHDNKIMIFVDGQIEAQTEFSGIVSHPYGTPLFIGRSQLSNRLHHGYIDEFKIIKNKSLYTEADDECPYTEDTTAGVCGCGVPENDINNNNVIISYVYLRGV